MGAKKDKDGFTPLQRLFVHEYLVDLNAEAAAIRSGYSERSAYSISCEIMKLPHVQAEIQKGMDKRAAKIDLNAETILRELFQIATVDIGEAYDDNGNLLPIKQMPKYIRKAISGIKVFEEFEGFGQDRRKIGEVREVKFWDKIKSNELLGKHLRLFADKIEHTGEIKQMVSVTKIDLDERINLIKSEKDKE